MHGKMTEEELKVQEADALDTLNKVMALVKDKEAAVTMNVLISAVVNSSIELGVMPSIVMVALANGFNMRVETTGFLSDELIKH